jgi:two-component system sensor histidine kinase EvgS
MEVARVQVDLLATVRTLAEVHQAGAARKGLALTFASGLAPSVTVLADTDATKFQQVLNNVVSNAVKFTSTGTVRVSVALDQQTFVVRVEDTGRGIGPEQLARIFDRFSTASTPGTAREQGTGLGLSLSRELVRLLGGSIHIASRPDEGTQVTIRLPGAPGGATSMILATTPGLVAVVDDVEGNRLLAQAYLERLGWRVRLHADAQSALDMTTSELPEAMLVDVRMPGMSGDQLASLLRAQPATARIRLVGYTAHALPDEIASLRASGFDDVLIKPVLMADMARALPRPAGG